MNLLKKRFPIYSVTFSHSKYANANLTWEIILIPFNKDEKKKQNETPCWIILTKILNLKLISFFNKCEFVEKVILIKSLQ